MRANTRSGQRAEAANQGQLTLNSLLLKRGLDEGFSRARIAFGRSNDSPPQRHGKKSNDDWRVVSLALPRILLEPGRGLLHRSNGNPLIKPGSDRD